MDDKFLTQLREDPRPDFSQELWERLAVPAQTKPNPTLRYWKPALAAMLVVTGTVALFSFPSVQAMAQDFLDLFRVKKFAAISVSPERLAELRDKKFNLHDLLATEADVKRPAEPVKVDNTAIAQDLARIPVLKPTQLPLDVTDTQILVQEGHSARFKADTEKLQAALETLGITDVSIPHHLNGSQVSINIPPAVVMNFKGERSQVALIQARSPEITLPPGVDLSQIGEIGLRIVGMSPEESRQFARKIDWNSTLLVPVPADAGAFREVQVRNTTGLLISSKDGRPRHSVLLWSENNLVYALMGKANNVDLIEMANSLK
ncbi:MAG: hypothetical protein K1Y36_26275 [Blastocatellia bacterium]|nr:hypothetical protein [Blastocatellia bacterium]